MADRRTFATTLASRSLAEFVDDRCPQLAAAIAYHVLFSLFPLAIFLAGVFAIAVQVTGVQADVVDSIVSNLPLSGSGADQLRRLLNGATSGLSALGLVGIVGVVWSASGMMASLRVALNDAWDVERTRPFLRGKLIDVGLVFAAATGALASLGITIAVRFVAGHATGAGTVGIGSGWATWLLGVAAPLAYAFGLTFALYRFIPAAQVRTRHAWPPALGVAGVFVLAENLFALYVRNFANYNAIYGSLGAVVAFMFFVYLSASIFLLGAEVASEIPRVAEAVALGEVEPGPPLAVQARQFLRGLWVRERRREGERQERRVEEERPRKGTLTRR